MKVAHETGLSFVTSISIETNNIHEEIITQKDKSVLWCRVKNRMTTRNWKFDLVKKGREDEKVNAK